MKMEIKALEDNKTWSIIDLPKGKKAIGSKWVYNIKYKANGEIERFKARLVAQGYSQREGLDYTETFSLISNMLRSVIALAASKGWSISQIDVYNVVLQGDLYEKAYMKLPQAFRRQGETKVCRLLKSLYGLKQALRQWNIKLSAALIAAGYIQGLRDYTLFTKKKSGGLCGSIDICR